MYRIANWNLERPVKGTKKTSLALEKISEINADILVLTETSKSINLEPQYSSITSKEFERTPEENWVAIWTKWEILSKITTFNSHRTACALIHSPFGKIIIYGTIIPYHMAGVKGERYGELGYKIWQYHEEDIINQAKDWKKIMMEYPDLPFFVIGDFNQTRDGLPKGYGKNSARELLTEKLNENALKCITEIDFAAKKELTIDPKKQKVRRNIDHICVSEAFLYKLEKYNVGAWDHFTKNGTYMSDHNGVYFDFKILK